MTDWISFWDTSHSIYVNDRHKAVHDRLVTDHLVALLDRPGLTLLDYGCGDTREAARLAAATGTLILSDAAPGVLARVADRYAGNPAIRVLSPDDVAALPDASVDRIAVVSVLQYLSDPVLDDLLGLFRRLLKPDGRLVLGDVLPPDLSMVQDVAALLRLAAGNGFLMAAGLGLARTLFSDYRRLRGELGLAHHAPSDLIARLARFGLSAKRLPVNIGHNQARYTLSARPVVNDQGPPLPLPADMG